MDNPYDKIAAESIHHYEMSLLIKRIQELERIVHALKINHLDINYEVYHGNPTSLQTSYR